MCSDIAWEPALDPTLSSKVPASCDDIQLGYRSQRRALLPRPDLCHCKETEGREIKRLRVFNGTGILECGENPVRA
jgi:hypothetical protein